MRMQDIMGPLSDYDEVDSKYSNKRNQKLGYGDNGKGRPCRSHDDTKRWSKKQMSDTGLTDKEPI